MNKPIFCDYSRKSDEAKERQEYSIEDQQAENKKYAEREKLSVVVRLSEERSAFKPDRRAVFDEMIRNLIKGIYDSILTWKENRLCRNPKEGGIIIQMLQDGIIKEIRCVSTNSVYTPDSDHLVLQIHFGMANQFSRNLSKDVRRGLSRKCERGEYPRPAPIGYTGYGEVRKRNIKPHPFEAPIIHQMYEKAATSKYSLGYLAEYAHRKGLTTKKGKPLSKSHLHRILTSPTNYGYFYQNGELYKGNFDSIIDKSLFDKVQKALKLRSKPKATSWQGDWNGLAFCADCGCAITTTHKTKYYKRTDRKVTYSYCHCTRRRDNCEQKPIPASKFESQLKDSLQHLSIDEDEWTLGMKLLQSKYSGVANTNAKQRQHYERQYQLTQEKLNGLMDMRALGDITQAEFKDQKKRHLTEQAKYQALIKDTKSSELQWFTNTEEYLDNAHQARSVMLTGTPEAKRDLILSVGENLYLRDGKLIFQAKQPYDVLLLPKYRTNLLRG
ncbi:recombinase family protein [Patescibacteria group bacterium]